MHAQYASQSTNGSKPLPKKDKQSPPKDKRSLNQVEQKVFVQTLKLSNQSLPNPIYETVVSVSKADQLILYSGFAKAKALARRFVCFQPFSKAFFWE